MMTGESLQAEQYDRTNGSSEGRSESPGLNGPKLSGVENIAKEDGAADGAQSRASEEWRRFYEAVKEITKGLRV